MNRGQRTPVRIVSQAEKVQYVQELEKQYPGYINENRKLTAIVWILTGIRVIYGLFYLAVSYFYEMGGAEGWMNLVGALFFFMWYSLMLRSGKFLAVVMLLFRGFGIVTGGASIMAAAPWLPLPLIFTLTLSVVIEFIEAVFCIYLLFNAVAARTVQLNYQMDHSMFTAGVSKETLEKMSEYKNPYSGGDDEKKAESEEPQEQQEKERTEEEN